MSHFRPFYRQVLEKQADLLTAKSEETTRNFISLKAFVDKKNASIQKHNLNSQKCRQRYLPKYRKMIKDCDRHCILERRIASMYKQRMEAIVEMLSDRCTNGEIVFDAKEAIAACRMELERLPTIEMPEGFEDRL